MKCPLDMLFPLTPKKYHKNAQFDFKFYQVKEDSKQII